MIGGKRIVRDHDDGFALIAIEHLQQLQHSFGAFAVQVAGRLIVYNYRRVGNQSTRNGNPLLLTA
jgi:hypothetical protein